MPETETLRPSVERRAIAFILDLAAVSIISGAAFRFSGTFLGSNIPGNPVTVFQVFSAALLVIYFTALETVYGQTPGKRLAGVRVVTDDGSSPDIYTSATRNLLRLVDALPVFYLAGIASVALTERRQRIGDLAAGTLVVEADRTPVADFF